jgi:hypothetical protein
MRLIRLAIPIVGSLVLIAGCGSSNSKLSYSAFSDAANALCKSGNAQVKASGSATSTANAANADTIDKVIKVANDTISKFKALSGPAALESARDVVVTDLGQTVTSAQAASSAARSGNQPAYDAAVKQLGSQDRQTNTDSSKLGAPDCTHG